MLITSSLSVRVLPPTYVSLNNKVSFFLISNFIEMGSSHGQNMQISLFCLLSCTQGRVEDSRLWHLAVACLFPLLSRFPSHETFHNLFITSLMSRFGATVNTAAENILVQESRHTCARISPGQKWERIAQSQNRLVLSFGRKCQTLFQRGGNNLHSHWQSMEIPFDSEPCLLCPSDGQGWAFSSLNARSYPNDWFIECVPMHVLIHKTPLCLWFITDLFCVENLPRISLRRIWVTCAWMTPTLKMSFL